MSTTAQHFHFRAMARSCGPIFIFLTMALCGCAINSERPQVPPGFLLKWDVSKAGSSVTQDFEVREYRRYRVELIFSPHARPLDNQAAQELYAVTGDGSLLSDSRGHTSLGTSNKAIGVVIPIRLIITPVPSSESRASTDSVNRLIDTKGIEGSRSIEKYLVVKDTPVLHPLSQGGMMRLIASAALHPGVYRLKVQAMNATAVPNNIETILSVSSATNTKALRDSD